MKITMIPIVLDTLGTISIGLVRELEELEIGRRAEIIQITALLKTARVLGRVLETRGDFRSLRLL